MKVIYRAVFCCLIMCLSLTFAEAQGEIRIQRDTLGASKIMIAVPGKWNKKVLILAHGLRMENSPLTADFEVEDQPYKQMLEDGWIIASTSYRRNGYIIEEAIEDLDQLREHVIARYGKPDRIFLKGGSMGGRIVTHIAEAGKGHYDGALAVGTVLILDKVTYSYDPKMPMLFLTNQTETEDAKAYVSRAADAAARPAFWLVARDGHCNTTGEEELAALRALFAYRETGKIEYDKNGTIVPEPPASVARFESGKAFARVKSMDVITEFTAADLQKLGIKKLDKFLVSFNGRSFTALYGTTFSDVPRGEWVGFLTAYGYLRISRNYESASAALGCKEGDTICIGPAEAAKGDDNAR